ncbi:MAG: CpsD/CapB family tyrosine-protein kinase [Deltaproteobacteria bacterium]|nr:CpsD/CapB family tyrosine-protein kinase [Deltaproteobacteria bacterium]MBW2140539.1 CpsD/CapB family tyrosine-protein kinase [Deltaproteobacteria bacterium]MBW2322462.1 CpsD/CapB family tyrosine-protein kinase [Deltaproteobacteria bacterium]
MKANQALLEEVMRIKVNLLQTGMNSRLKSIMITSASSGEGTSTVAYHLGLSFALGGKSRVLVVDANIRNPSMHILFEREQKNGFFDFLDGKIELSESIKDTSFQNVKVMTTGQQRYGDVLGVFADISRDVKDSIEKDFDWVIYDTSPVNRYPDTLVMTHLSDGIILVISAEKIRRAAVQKAKESLESIDAKILGGVLNGRKYVVPRFIYKRL